MTHRPSSSRLVDHPAAVGVNPDASLYFAARGNGGLFRRGPNVHSGFVDNAGLPGVEILGGPLANTPPHNTLDRGRNGYKSRPERDSAHTGKIDPPGPSAFSVKPRKPGQGIPSHGIVALRAVQHDVKHGTGLKLGGLDRCRAVLFGSALFIALPPDLSRQSFLSDCSQSDQARNLTIA